MNESSKYRELLNFEFDEIDIEIQETQFIINYSQLSFNDGFLLKTITVNNKEHLKFILNNITKPNYKFDINNKFQPADKDVNDFLYNLIKNDHLREKKWGINEQDEDFFNIIEKYDSAEKFKTLSIYELDKNKFGRRLYEEAKKGSIYDDWLISDRQTEKMVSEFINKLVDRNSTYRMFEYENWGDYIMGYFLGFIIINVENAQITFFVKDDYD